MIPVQLQLKNFLSYGEDVPPLDFTRFNIACLSGGNGQGKSALLDALTWAIWGEGRKSGQEKKADNGLLKMGETEMWVDLTLDQEGDRYRIIRKYSKIKSRNHSELELMVYDDKKSEYLSLSLPSIRQTQQRINRLLRMDYSTFINSAFILQGRVDEFTRKNARERKEILSEVLGLSHYENLSVLARQHYREIEKEFIAHKNRLNQIEKEIKEKDSLLGEMKRIQISLEEQNFAIKNSEESIRVLEKESIQLNFEKQKSLELITRIKMEKNDLQEFIKKKKRINQEIIECQKFLLQEKKILSDYHLYLSVYQENRQILQVMQQYRELEEKKRELERVIEKEKNKQLLELGQLKQHYEDLSRKASLLARFQKERENLERRLEKFEEISTVQEEIQQEGNQLNLVLDSKKNQVDQLTEEIIRYEEKIKLLRTGTRQSCPLCQSSLDEQNKQNILRNLGRDIKKNQNELRRISKEMDELFQKKTILQEKWKKNREQLTDREKIQNQYQAVSWQIIESEKAEQQAIQLKDRIGQFNKRMDKYPEILELREDLAQTEKKMEGLGYDEKRHYRTNQQIQELKDAPLEKEKLGDMLKSTKILEKDFVELIKKIDHKKRVIRDLNHEFQDISAKIKTEIALEERLKNQKLIFKRLQQEQFELYRLRGAFQEKVEQITQFEQEADRIKKVKEDQFHDLKLLNRLIAAFGKNGIQAMIIENAIPELEEEANLILARLSDENTNIHFESLKELKSGEMKETLDIQIHDQTGIKPYELYSGGETFRIDFAIRIALSKLLAYRAGARLRTLVIDEGFGTQDEDGLQKLIQAIRSIQDDFDKILVITHLPLLKDAFPVRIEIWKDPVAGSRFQIIYL